MSMGSNEDYIRSSYVPRSRVRYYANWQKRYRNPLTVDVTRDDDDDIIYLGIPRPKHNKLSMPTDEEPLVERNILHSTEESPQRSESQSLVKCRACLEDYEKIQKRNGVLMSTKCGHLMCRQCMRSARRVKKCICPVCKKKFRSNNVHPVYP